MGDRIADDVEDVLLANGVFHHAENAGDDYARIGRGLAVTKMTRIPASANSRPMSGPRRSVCQVEVDQCNIGLAFRHDAPGFPSARCNPHRLVPFIAQ